MTTNAMPAGKNLTALLAAMGTFVLVWLLSPGLRSDIGQAAVFLSEIDAVGIKDWMLSFGAWAPLVYFLVMVAQVIASPIPAGPVTLAGALIFGVVPGLALSMAGSVVGSVIVFLAVRRWGEALVLKVVDEKTYSRYAGKLDGSGWWFFFIMLLPLMPDDAVCALAGLSAMSFRRYVAFMVVGRLPGATLTALLASETITGSTAAWVSVALIVAVLLVLGFVYRDRLESWLLRSAEDGKRP
ncbi:MAG: TVP38/TMEM64 family protein [Rubrobacteraceae bacterium]